MPLNIFAEVHEHSERMLEARRPAAWTDISTDFDPDEETANFGTRYALESEGNIYEVISVADRIVVKLWGGQI